MTAIEYEKSDSFVESSSRRDDVRIILGESFVLLINSSIAGSIILFIFFSYVFIEKFILADSKYKVKPEQVIIVQIGA